METLLQVLQKTTAFFQTKGIESARLDAELLFAHVLGLRRLDLYLQFERPLTNDDLDRLRPLVRRRSQREPLQYITGEAAFDRLNLKVDSRVLIPRSETEELVDRLVTSLPAMQSVLDLGTGSGAIALALAGHWPDARATAVDCSEASLALASANAEDNRLQGRVRFVQSNWFESLDGERFDLIVSNPPYLTEQEWADAEPEVRQFEPRHALVADRDGCADLLAILSQAPHHLTEAGVVALETGIDQHDALTAHALSSGYGWVLSRKDLQLRPRFLLAGLPAATKPEWH